MLACRSPGKVSFTVDDQRASLLGQHLTTDYFSWMTVPISIGHPLVEILERVDLVPIDRRIPEKHAKPSFRWELTCSLPLLPERTPRRWAYPIPALPGSCSATLDEECRQTLAHPQRTDP